MRQQITIRVPASTSNLGPGFDCLGVALRLYNFFTIGRAKDQTAFSRRGSGSDRFGKIVADAAALFFKRAKQSRFAFSCLANENVPRSRGLGASATIRLAVSHGVNHVAARPRDPPAIFQPAAELEGHPDNFAPASLGGFTVVRDQNVQRFQVSPRLRFVLLIPNFEIQTPAARKILPAKISRTAAVESAGNAAAIAAAFASRNYENLRDAFVDHLHQPFREKLIPFLPRV